MSQLTNAELVVFLLSISVILIGSRIIAEAGKKIGLPVLIGEILVGILLGPTFLGSFFKDFSFQLFPQSGPAAYALDALYKLAAILLLFISGMEVQLPVLLRQGKLALYTSLTSIAIPFTIGFWTAWHFPEWIGWDGKSSNFVYALFFGTALSITALPVIEIGRAHV